LLLPLLVFRVGLEAGSCLVISVCKARFTTASVSCFSNPHSLLVFNSPLASYRLSQWVVFSVMG
jgi:hypothetical protein